MEMRVVGNVFDYSSYFIERARAIGGFEGFSNNICRTEIFVRRRFSYYNCVGFVQGGFLCYR